MSLTDPTKFDKLIEWLSTPSKARKALVYAVIGIIALGAILWAANSISNRWSNRQIDKLKANVNAAMVDLQQSQVNIAVGKEIERQALENVNVATQQFTEAVNATDSAKTETNRALQNLASAVNSNRPVNITVDQLEKQLKELGQ